MRTPILCSIAVAAITALMLPACGGDVTSGGSNDTCPPGSACPPDCTSGAPCSDAASDAPAQPIGDDASTSLDANYPAGSVPPTSATVSALAYGVVDAKYSTALSSIVIVSATPTSALHLYDVTTASDRSVALPEAPVAVAVAPNGLTAAVAFDAQVSLVDLTSGTITTTCAVSSDAYDVALSSTGIAYVLPHTGGDVPVHAIDFSSCNEVLGGVFSAPSRIALHPSEQALFIAEQGLYPSRILRCDVSSSPAECVDSADDADWGTYETCGNLWISADGARIYSACGVTISGERHRRSLLLCGHARWRDGDPTPVRGAAGAARRSHPGTCGRGRT
jgi:hypothetical protein